MEAAKAAGLKQIDYLVVSHYDIDHLGDVPALAAAFPGCRRAASAAAALLELPADRPTLVTGSLRLAGEVLVAIGGDHA